MAANASRPTPEDDSIEFADEASRPTLPPASAWRVLAVDDDQDFQRSLALAFKNIRILGRPVELVQAFSVSEAARLLARDRDYAVILADVVMGSARDGLKLVKGIRGMLGLTTPRIVLLTGQPNFAPIDQAMEDYDLTDYCLKSDLATRGLKNILTGALRAYAQLTTIATAHRGLERILEASNQMAGARSIAEVARTLLDGLGALLQIPIDGMIAIQAGEVGIPGVDAATEARIVGAAGCFAETRLQPLNTIPHESARRLLNDALSGRVSIDRKDCQVLYFPRQHAMAEYAVYLATPRPLDAQEQELLRVFAANAAKGFGNVALISRLDQTAFTDALLNIPNRSALLRELGRLRGDRNGSGYRLVLLDVDNYGGLNDAFGVALGDRVLTALVARLQQRFAPPTLIARIAGDVFAILGKHNAVGTAHAAAVFEEPLAVGEDSYHLSACTTEIALDARDGDSADLLSAAWGSLRAAKARGPGSAQHYDPEVERRTGERFALISRLGKALRDEVLFLVFQPQVDLRTGAVTGAEALLRWPTDDGFIPPNTFIPLAEQSSHIDAIGALVTRHTCRALQQLAQAGLGKLCVSMNVSARQFDANTFSARLAEACAEAGVSPDQVGLEVTETAVMQSVEAVIDTLHAHRRRGGSVAIDDFGTGMSSLSYLLQLPIDHLKIDQSFVSRLESDPRSRTLARMIIDLGHTIGASLIAEGVETDAQADWLRSNGCETAQGWRFARPMPLPEFIDFCRAARSAD